MPVKSLLTRTAAALALGCSSLALSAAPAAAQDGDILVTAERPELIDQRIPGGEFVKAPNMQQVRISPDGSKLAYIAGKDGREVLVVLDLTTMQEKPILAAEEAREAGDRTMTGFRWIGNNHVVMTMLSRENLNGQLSDFRRLVAYDVKDGELTQQAWRDAGGDAGVILHIDHDTGTYLLQRDSTAESTERWFFPEVVEVDVDSGRFERVQRTNPVVRQWVADGQGNIRAGYNSDRDSGKFRMLYASEGESTLKTVYNEADATFTESLPTPEMFIPGTDLAYVISNHEGHDKVYKMNMETMEIVETVFETPGFDVQGIITDEDETRIIGYRTFDGMQRAVFTDELMAELKQVMEQTFGEDDAAIVDYSENLSKVVVFGGGQSRGGAYYLFDTNTGDMKLLNWQRSALKDAPLNPVKAEWYEANDGTRMQAIVTYPRHREGEKNLPVVVMPHGGPFGATSYANQGAFAWNQALAEQGYVVIEPNYRGSGGYGKDFVQIGREPGGYGKRMQDDKNDVLTWFGQKGVIDPDRACIMGWSYGGYAAARGAQRDPDVWRCAIAGAGVYDMALMNKWDRKNLGKFSEGFQATSDDPDGISAARNASGDWAPILIVAAKRDARIPMEQSEALVSALKRAGKVEGRDYRYVVQEQGTHNLPYDDVHIEWIDETLAWLDRFNPAYTEADGDSPPPLARLN